MDRRRYSAFLGLGNARVEVCVCDKGCMCKQIRDHTSSAFGATQSDALIWVLVCAGLDRWALFLEAGDKGVLD